MYGVPYDRRSRLHYHTIKWRNTRVTTERGNSGRSVASASSSNMGAVCAVENWKCSKTCVASNGGVI